MNIPQGESSWSNRDLIVEEKKDPEVVYAVPWIESEWGQRDEGYRLFLDLAFCIESTKESSARGPYPGGGGYCGPVRPLFYYEVPFSCLEVDLKANIQDPDKDGVTHTTNWWKPKFKGDCNYI